MRHWRGCCVDRLNSQLRSDATTRLGYGTMLQANIIAWSSCIRL
jgi:hypothetical protein